MRERCAAPSCGEEAAWFMVSNFGSLRVVEVGSWKMAPNENIIFQTATRNEKNEVGGASTDFTWTLDD
eukprot:scaffold70281_cov67-Cyclotella_meneghiniana.AAC.14